MGESPETGASRVGDAGAPSGSAAKGGLMAWPYSRALIAAGLVTQFAGMLLLTALDLATIAFALPIMLPAIILCALALTQGKPWQFMGAGVTIILLPLLLIAFAPDYLVNPQYGIAFTGSVLALLSIWLATPAGLWVYRHRDDGLPVMTVREGLRTRSGVLTVLVAGFCLGAMATGQAAYINAASSGGAAADFAVDVHVTLDAVGFFFVPDTINVPAGEVVELTVVNKDAALHTFTYTVGSNTSNPTTYNHDLLPQSTARFLILITEPGTVPFWCIPHKDMGMVGTMQVA